MIRLLLISLTLLVLSGCVGASLTKESEEAKRMRPVTIQVPKTVNGITLVLYADRALDLDRVPVEGIKVAVVHPQSVLERTKAGIRALATYKEDTNAKHKVLIDMEADLRAQDANGKKIPESSPDRAAANERFINAKIAFMEKMGEFNDQLEARQAELVQEFFEKIQKTTERVASMSGIDLVLDTFENSNQPKANVPLPVLELMKRATKNLTADVIEEFDRTYK